MTVFEMPRSIGRWLTCIRCHEQVEVFEAAQGAHTDAGHRWINPAEYECGDCAFKRQEQPETHSGTTS